MGKGIIKKLNKGLLVLAAASFLITLMEGCYYYTLEEYPNRLFRALMILQNSVEAFGFSTSISIKDVLQSLNSESSMLQIVVGYAYGFATFTAPYCTIAVAYKLLSQFLRFKGWRRNDEKLQHILVFGYNEETKALLLNRTAEEKQRKIHLIVSEISEEEELELLQLGIAVHKVDCLKLSGKKLENFWERIQLKCADTIILFEESSARNFSLYYMFHADREEGKAPLKAEVKFFCRCEDEGISRMLEDYHDSQAADSSDLEIVSMPELRARKMLQDHPLHSYYLKSGEQDTNKWNLHLLIIGFGKLGQEILRQSMNQGVTGSKNNILIDVVDYNIEEKQSIFANHFSDEYVVMGEEEYIIPSDRADGQLRIRFHQMDTRYKEFGQMLRECGDPEKDGVYTYIAICIEDMNISLHCMSEVERYYRRFPQLQAEKYVDIGLRMESDKQLAHYFSTDKETHKNVFAIEENEDVLSLDMLLSDSLDTDAKEYNYIYNSIAIQSAEEPVQENSTVSKDDFRRYWKGLKLFRRNSSRALAHHAAVKEDVYDLIQKVDLEELFGADGSILQNVGNTWIYQGTMDEFVQKQSDSVNYPLVSEVSRMEHRRWCYFMASCGWKRTEDTTAKRDEKQRANPCMCTWDDLTKYQSHTCCYDLMPLLLKYKKDCNKTVS